MQTNSHILRTAFQAVVVRLYVGIQEYIVVDTAFFHAFDHGFGAEVCQEGVVELDVAYIPSYGSGRCHSCMRGREGKKGREDVRHPAA